MSDSPEVSIIVPALNEEDTIREVVERCLALPMRVQVIVVNDGSDDQTGEILSTFGDRITYIQNPERTGKGAAIVKALPLVNGEVTIIQDADLEYAPEQIPDLVRPILERRADAVYGNRFANGFPVGMALPNKLVNRLLSWAVALLFWKRVPDEATCYKAFRSDLLRQMHLTCRRFEFCPEVTAKSLRMKLRMLHLPIRYEPRSKQAGKKIRWTDAPDAFWTLLRHRFSKF